MRLLRPVALMCSAIVLAGCSSGGSPTPAASDTAGPATSAPASSPAGSPAGGEPPGLDVQVVTRGLKHGWDVGFLPDGKVLLTQKEGKITLLSNAQPGATKTDVQADLSDVADQGEGGLLGMVPHPDFSTSRQFTTCQNHEENGESVDVRLVTWRLSDDERSATKVKDLLTGLPVNPSGRHSGCRPTIGPDGALIVGTGDTARGNISQDLTSLGGKTLRLNLNTGEPMPDNPFITASDQRQRYVYTYGHRNVQGIAVRPSTGQVYSVEHGSSRDDEVNILQAGKNYGWDPSQGGTVGGYDESVPMTDTDRFPDAVRPVWTSGETTKATCAGVFLTGSQWGAWDGALAVTSLKASQLLVMTVDRAGAVTNVTIPPELDQTYRRYRAARLGPDGALYVTTSDGGDDVLLRIAPKQN